MLQPVQLTWMFERCGLCDQKEEVKTGQATQSYEELGSLASTPDFMVLQLILVSVVEKTQNYFQLH